MLDATTGTKLLAHALLLAFAAAIAVRRRAPLPSIAVTYVVFVVAIADPALSEGLFGPYFAVILMNYSLGANTDGRALVAGVALAAIGIYLAFRLDQLQESLGDWLFGATIMHGGPVLAGRLLRSRSLLNRALREKAGRLERDRAAAAEKAAQDERARIAAELDDVVAHALGAMVVQGAAARRLTRADPAAAEAAYAEVEATGREALGELRRLRGRGGVSALRPPDPRVLDAAAAAGVMVVQAGGARRILRRDPGRTEEAGVRIEQAGREALAEMRQLLGFLRAEDGPPAHGRQPGLGELGAPVERARGAGLRVAVQVEGEPRALAPGLDLAAYRILQEGLTNALKHAGSAPTVVAVRWAPDTLELEMADRGDGTPRNGAVAHSGGGHGLVGMGERVHLYGGVLETGRREGGGFAVRARLPLGDKEPV